jgi:hypothetical protein
MCTRATWDSRGLVTKYSQNTQNIVQAERRNIAEYTTVDNLHGGNVNIVLPQQSLQNCS